MLVYVLFIEDAGLGDEGKSVTEKAKTLFIQYKQLQHELESYNPDLLKKKTVIGVSKSDLYDAKLCTAIKKVLPTAMMFSSATHDGLDVLKNQLVSH